MAADELETSLERSPERSSVWGSIASSLTAGIVSGAHAPGTRLPTEHSLALQYGVNRHTVRRALSSLAAQGLVRVVQGSGTFVEEFAVDVVLGRRPRHSVVLQNAGVSGGMRLLDARALRASAEVARALELAPRARVLRLHLLGEAQGRPLHAAVKYFPLPRCAGLDSRIERSGSITEALRELGIDDYIRRESRIAAVMPGSEVAALLAQPATRPVLRVRAVNVDPLGVPIEYATTFFAGDRVTLLVQPDV
jgi:GntR family phosphonate transport system transcriptional regulator